MSKLARWLLLVNGVAVFALGAERLKWPSADYWSGRGPFLIAALACTALVPAIQAGLSEFGERSRRRLLERERKVQAFLITSLIYIARNAGADWENTGIQAFVVRGLRNARQERIAKVRLGAIPSSGVQWSKGKGVIGRCWATRREQYEDLDAQFAPYADYTEGQWTALTDQQRFGLTYTDFLALRGKYGIVAAVPIVRNDKYVGCVTADMPPLPAGAGQPNRQQILQSLATTASLVAHVLDD